MQRRTLRFILVCISILVVVSSVVCSLPAMVLSSLSTATPVSTFTPMPSATFTPQPTPTNTPVPTTGSLSGQLVERELDESNQTFVRTSLSNVLVVLCVVDDNTCIINADLSTRTDADGRFSFSALEPGEYVLFFNPFEIYDPDQYNSWLGGREITLSPLSDLIDSVSEEGETVYISAEPDGGVSMSIDAAGNLGLSEALPGTALWVLENPLVLEFGDNSQLVSAEVEIGETTDITVGTHFCETDMNVSVDGSSSGSTVEQVATSTPQPESNQPASSAEGIEVSFDDNQLGWYEDNYNDNGSISKYEIRDGQYFWEYTGDPLVYDIIIPENSPVQQDFFASVDVQFKHDQPDVEEATYGIVYRYQDDDHYYIFEINSSGSFDVWMVLPGDGSDFLAFEVEEWSIDPDGINNLAVEGIGDHFNFYINGNKVYELDDSNIPGGEFGLFADLEVDNDGNQSIVWDNFIVSQP